jgi:anti-anti-sigma factor
MDIAIRQDDRLVTITPKGELDLHSATRLDAELRRLAGGEVECVRLDMSCCTFIDSSALGLLLRWRERCEREGRTFEVTGAQGAVRRVFHMTGALPT